MKKIILSFSLFKIFFNLSDEFFSFIDISLKISLFFLRNSASNIYKPNIFNILLIELKYNNIYGLDELNQNHFHAKRYKDIEPQLNNPVIIP